MYATFDLMVIYSYAKFDLSMSKDKTDMEQRGYHVQNKLFDFKVKLSWGFCAKYDLSMSND